MVIVRVHLLRGRSPEIKYQLMRELTDHVVSALGVDRQEVRVFFVELDPEDWGIAGIPASILRAAPDTRSGP